MKTENKKYELLQNDTVTTWNGKTLYRIRALVAIGSLVAAGELGGYVESEGHLSVYGNAWVSGNAQVYGDAQVSGNAQVYGNARVYGDAQVYGDALVYGDAQVSGNDAIIWFSKVGSENGTMTVYRAKDNTLLVTRGCFLGTDDEFLLAVDKKHGDSKIGKEYRLLIEVAHSRLGK